MNLFSYIKNETYINVEPDGIFLADVRDGADGVEGAVDGRAGRAVDEERQVALTLVADDQLLQFSRNHPTPFFQIKKKNTNVYTMQEYIQSL